MDGPTPREALLRRRNEYLARVALPDAWNVDEQVDGRPADQRRFRRGGDDVPPDCVPPPDARRRRHRVPRYPDGNDPQREAADRRLRTGRSDQADYDYFALGPHPEWGLPRITAVLVHSAGLARRGRRLTPAEIFDLSGEALPAGDDTADALGKAWTLLGVLRFDVGPILTTIETIIGQAPWTLDPWNAENAAAATSPPSPGGASPPPDPPWVAMPDALLRALADVRDGDGRARAARKVRPPGATEQPEQPGVDWSDCAPRPPETTPPGPPPPAPRDVTPLLPEAALGAADALLAAFGSASASGLVDDLRALGLTDALIARLLAWMAAVWASVDDAARPAGASDAWRAAHPVETLFARGPGSADWRLVPGVVYLLRVLGRIAALPVHRAAMRLVALADSRVFSARPFTHSTGERDVAGDDLLRPAGEAAAWTVLDREIVAGADALSGRFGAGDDALFRLVLSRADEGDFAGFVEPTLGRTRPRPAAGPFAPDAATAPGRADELPLPTYDELSAFYWQEVVAPSTAGHILYLHETADFKVADHLRFLGHFRPGGVQRPLAGAPGYDEGYERWVASVVPDWFVDFATVALLRFKYWVTDGKTTRTDEKEMTFWSENHIALFTAGEYIAGQWWPDDVFPFTGARGAWHRERAAVRLERWLHDRLRLGFCEVNSPVYYGEHLEAVFNVVDFVEDERLRRLGLMVLDLLVFDVVQRVCRGSFVSVTARVYGDGKSSGWRVSIRDFIEVLTGTLGEVSSAREEAAVALCTSRYLRDVPECLLVIAESTDAATVARARTSLSFDDAEALGIGTESADDIVFWWAHSAYFTDRTYRSTQAWSYRWHLRASGPFVLFEKIDYAGIRLAASVVAGLETLVIWAALYTFYMPLALFFTPRAIRSAVDLVTSILDAAIGIAAWAGKGLGLLDANDDRVRVAKPAFEQEFERLAIETSAGSVVERQHLYVWRSADAMLSSMVDQGKGLTSAQREVCIATLGPDVAVFVTKPLDVPSGVLPTLGRMTTGAAGGFAENVEIWKTIPGALDQPTRDESAAPELSEALFAGATGAAAGDIFAEGPQFWQGQVSNPLVWQYENVAVAIYKPNAHQRDISGDHPKTHAFWPWDHFDEVRGEDASGGRWVFGRRDRRDEPRTPAPPRAEWRPSEATPWPEKRRWPEPTDPLGGSGYVALFSARGLRTTPADPSTPPPPPDKDGKVDNSRGWGHKELIADGHDNVWVTVVGDRATYGSFDAFVDAVRACRLDASPDDGTCTVEIPMRPGPRGDDRPRLTVSWDDGATLDRDARGELTTDGWPRFAVRGSDQSSVGAPRYTVIGAADIANRVDWGDTRWTIAATVDVPVDVPVDGPDDAPSPGDGPAKVRPVRLTLVHDFGDLQHPVRTVTNLPPSRRPAPPDTVDDVPPRVLGARSADPQPLAPAQSRLGDEFRTRRRALVAQPRRPHG